MQGIWTVTQGLPAPLGREPRLGSVDASVSVCFSVALGARWRYARAVGSRSMAIAVGIVSLNSRIVCVCGTVGKERRCPARTARPPRRAPGAAMRAFPSISRGAQPCGLGGCAPKPRLSKPSAQARLERPAFRTSRLNRVESGRAELARSRLSANTGPRARTGQGRFSPAPRRRHAGRAARTCGPRRPVTGQSSPSARAVERKRDPVHTIRESGEGLSSTPLRLRDANRDSLGPNNQGATVSARPAYKILVIARRQSRIAACGQTPPRKCGSCVAGMTHAPPRGYPNAAHAYRRGADGPGQGAAEKKRRHAPETGFRACVSPARSIRFMHDCVLVVFMTIPLWLVARRSSRHGDTDACSAMPKALFLASVPSRDGCLHAVAGRDHGRRYRRVQSDMAATLARQHVKSAPEFGRRCDDTTVALDRARAERVGPRRDAGKPAASIASRRRGRLPVVDENGRDFGFEPWREAKPPPFADALARNVMAGYTTVMSRAAHDLVCTVGAPDVPCRDWRTCILVAGACGRVVRNARRALPCFSERPPHTQRLRVALCARRDLMLDARRLQLFVPAKHSPVHRPLRPAHVASVRPSRFGALVSQ